MSTATTTPSHDTSQHTTSRTATQLTTMPVTQTTRHAVRAALRDSLGLIGPLQKHHWAEHLAMPCPA